MGETRATLFFVGILTHRVVLHTHIVCEKCVLLCTGLDGVAKLPGSEPLEVQDYWAGLIINQELFLCVAVIAKLSDESSRRLLSHLVQEL